MLLDAPVDTERASSVLIEGALPPHSQSILDAVKMLNTIQPEEIDLEQAWRVNLPIKSIFMFKVSFV